MAMKRNSDLSGSRPVVKGSQTSRPSTQSTSSVSRLEGGGLVASNAQALFDKALARLEAQEEERAAQAPNLFSPSAIEVLQQAPADRDLTRLKLVVKDLKNTAFFQALPDEKQDTSYWMKILRSAVFKKELRADDVLFDKTHVTRQHQDLHAKSPELLSSPSQLINRGRWLGKKQMTTSGLNVLNVEEYANDCLYIIISGGVHVVKHAGDSGSLLSTGDACGAMCPLAGLADPLSVVVFCNHTDVLEISTDLLKQAYEMQIHDYTRFLKSTRLFSMMSEAQVQQIAPLLDIKKYRSNEVVGSPGKIVREGEPATDLFILAHGTVRVIKEVVVPYKMGTHGYTRTPSETCEPICPSAVTTLAHVRQGRFHVKSKALHTVNSASTQLYRPKKHRATNESERALQETTKEILSARGNFVSVIGRLKVRAPRESIGERDPDTKKNKTQPKNLKSAMRAIYESGAPPSSGHKTEEVEETVAQKKEREKNTRSLVVELRQMWKGSYFGELSLLNKAPKSASVIAATPVQVFVMSKINFFRQFDEKQLNFLRELALENDYCYNESQVGKSLDWESKWTEYRQNVASDTLFKASAHAQYSTQRQNQHILDQLLQDPGIAEALTPKEQEPRLSSLQIRRMRSPTLEDRLR